MFELHYLLPGFLGIVFGNIIGIYITSGKYTADRFFADVSSYIYYVLGIGVATQAWGLFG